MAKTTDRMRAAALALTLAPALAGFEKGPYLQGVDTRGATVMWTNDSSEPAKLTIRKPGQNKDVARVVVGATTCGPVWEASVGGLQAGERYTYLLEQGADRAEGTFHTAPRAGRPFTGVIYGDNRSDDRAHGAVVNRILLEDPDFIVHTGDLVVEGDRQDEWHAFFTIAGPLLRSRPIYPISGNHERSGDRDIEQFRQYFHLPNGEYYFGFTWGNVRFLAIDVNVQAQGGAPNAEQATWLMDQVRRAEAEPGITHTVAFMHQGPFSSNPARTGNLAVRDLIERMHGAGLDLLVSGHDHYYERGRSAYGMPYLVVGSGGAPLYPTRGPGQYGAYDAFVSVSQHAFVKMRSTGQALSLCAVNLDGVAFDCYDLPRNRGRAPAP